VAVTVEAKLSTVSPAVADSPQHGLATQFVEAIGGINKESSGGFGGCEIIVISDRGKGLIHGQVT
jgi:hypothetical protein